MTTVKELIKKLQELPQDIPISYEFEGYYYEPILQEIEVQPLELEFRLSTKVCAGCKYEKIPNCWTCTNTCKTYENYLKTLPSTILIVDLSAS